MTRLVSESNSELFKNCVMGMTWPPAIGNELYANPACHSGDGLEGFDSQQKSERAGPRQNVRHEQPIGHSQSEPKTGKAQNERMLSAPRRRRRPGRRAQASLEVVHGSLRINPA